MVDTSEGIKKENDNELRILLLKMKKQIATLFSPPLLWATILFSFSMFANMFG